MWPTDSTKLEPKDKGDTLKIIRRLEHLESVMKQHIQYKIQHQTPLHTESTLHQEQIDHSGLGHCLRAQGQLGPHE